MKKIIFIVLAAALLQIIAGAASDFPIRGNIWIRDTSKVRVVSYYTDSTGVASDLYGRMDSLGLHFYYIDGLGVPHTVTYGRYGNMPGVRVDSATWADTAGFALWSLRSDSALFAWLADTANIARLTDTSIFAWYTDTLGKRFYFNPADSIGYLLGWREDPYTWPNHPYWTYDDVLYPSGTWKRSAILGDAAVGKLVAVSSGPASRTDPWRIMLGQRWAYDEITPWSRDSNDIISAFASQMYTYWDPGFGQWRWSARTNHLFDIYQDRAQYYVPINAIDIYSDMLNANDYIFFGDTTTWEGLYIDDYWYPFGTTIEDWQTDPFKKGVSLVSDFGNVNILSDSGITMQDFNYDSLWFYVSPYSVIIDANRPMRIGRRIIDGGSPVYIPNITFGDTAVSNPLFGELRTAYFKTYAEASGSDSSEGVVLLSKYWRSPAELDDTMAVFDQRGVDFRRRLNITSADDSLWFTVSDDSAIVDANKPMRIGHGTVYVNTDGTVYIPDLIVNRTSATGIHSDPYGSPTDTVNTSVFSDSLLSISTSHYMGGIPHGSWGRDYVKLTDWQDNLIDWHPAIVMIDSSGLFTEAPPYQGRTYGRIVFNHNAAAGDSGAFLFNRGITTTYGDIKADNGNILASGSVSGRSGDFDSISFIYGTLPAVFGRDHYLAGGGIEGFAWGEACSLNTSYATAWGYGNRVDGILGTAAGYNAYAKHDFSFIYNLDQTGVRCSTDYIGQFKVNSSGNWFRDTLVLWGNDDTLWQYLENDTAKLYTTAAAFVFNKPISGLVSHSDTSNFAWHSDTTNFAWYADTAAFSWYADTSKLSWYADTLGRLLYYDSSDSSLQINSGGNARGRGAVDLQVLRLNAAQVASGSRATISGGENNTASGSRSTVSGGQNNTASGVYSIVLGGLSCTASGTSSIAAPYATTSSGDGSISFGRTINNAGEDAFAAGYNHTISATGDYSASLGYMNTLDGNFGVAIGALCKVRTNAHGMAFGWNAISNKDRAVIFNLEFNHAESTDVAGQFKIVAPGNVLVDGGIYMIDDTGADSSWWYNTEDSTIIDSDNPIRIGHNSIKLSTDGLVSINGLKVYPTGDSIVVDNLIVDKIYNKQGATFTADSALHAVLSDTSDFAYWADSSAHALRADSSIYALRSDSSAYSLKADTANYAITGKSENSLNSDSLGHLAPDSYFRSDQSDTASLPIYMRYGAYEVGVIRYWFPGAVETPVGLQIGIQDSTPISVKNGWVSAYRYKGQTSQNSFAVDTVAVFPLGLYGTKGNFDTTVSRLYTITDASQLSYAYLYDTGDTTVFSSDNPIKLGSSLVLDKDGNVIVGGYLSSSYIDLDSLSSPVWYTNKSAAVAGRIVDRAYSSGSGYPIVGPFTINTYSVKNLPSPDSISRYYVFSGLPADTFAQLDSTGMYLRGIMSVETGILLRDATKADSSWWIDTGDTTKIFSDNPMRVGTITMLKNGTINFDNKVYFYAGDTARVEKRTIIGSSAIDPIRIVRSGFTTNGILFNITDEPLSAGYGGDYGSMGWSSNTNYPPLWVKYSGVDDSYWGTVAYFDVDGVLANAQWNKKIILTDNVTGADSSWWYDTGDSTIIDSDNPIRLGHNSVKIGTDGKVTIEKLLIDSLFSLGESTFKADSAKYAEEAGKATDAENAKDAFHAYNSDSLGGVNWTGFLRSDVSDTAFTPLYLRDGIYVLGHFGGWYPGGAMTPVGMGFFSRQWPDSMTFAIRQDGARAYGYYGLTNRSQAAEDTIASFPLGLESPFMYGALHGIADTARMADTATFARMADTAAFVKRADTLTGPFWVNNLYGNGVSLILTDENLTAGYSAEIGSFGVNAADADKSVLWLKYDTGDSDWGVIPYRKEDGSNRLYPDYFVLDSISALRFLVTDASGADTCSWFDNGSMTHLSSDNPVAISRNLVVYVEQGGEADGTWEFDTTVTQLMKVKLSTTDSLWLQTDTDTARVQSNNPIKIANAIRTTANGDTAKIRQLKTDTIYNSSTIHTDGLEYRGRWKIIDQVPFSHQAISGANFGVAQASVDSPYFYYALTSSGTAYAWAQLQVPTCLPSDTLRHIFGDVRDSILGFKYAGYNSSNGFPYVDSINVYCLIRNSVSETYDTLFRKKNTFTHNANPSSVGGWFWVTMNDLKDSLYVLDPVGRELFFRFKFYQRHSGGYIRLLGGFRMNFDWKEH